MKDYIINVHELPRVKLGWINISKINEYLGENDSEIRLLYLFKTKELVITDEKLYEILLKLNINYEHSTPNNSIKYVRESGSD